MKNLESQAKSAVLLGLPDHPFIHTRLTKAQTLVESGAVAEIDSTRGLYEVKSQSNPLQSYIVQTNHGAPHCNCLDARDKRVLCKHQLSARLYMQKQQAQKLTIYDDSDNLFMKRGRWIVTDPKAKAKFIVYRDSA